MFPSVHNLKITRSQSRGKLATSKRSIKGKEKTTVLVKGSANERADSKLMEGVVGLGSQKKLPAPQQMTGRSVNRVAISTKNQDNRK